MTNYKTITKGMLLTLMVMLFSMPVFAATGNASIYINDVKQSMTKDMPQAFMDKDGRIQIPLRFIVEVMGNTIKWDGKTQQADINNGRALISFIRYEYRILGDEETGYADCDWFGSVCDIKVPSMTNTKFYFRMDGSHFQIGYAKS